MNKETLTDYIVKGNWKQFFSVAIQLCSYDSDRSSVTLLQSRINSLENNWGKGILSQSDYNMETNRIKAAALSLLMDLDYTKFTVNTTNTTVNNTTVNNITVAPVTTAKNDKFDPFYLSPEVTSRIETFMSLIRKYIILAAQVNMILPEIFDNCIEFIGELQESLMSFVTSENSEERDEILESLEEYQSSLVELESTARKEFKRAQGSEKNQVAQLLKAVAVGNKKNMQLFKDAYAVFEQLEKGHLVSVPKVLPVNATSLGLLVKKWIRLANS